MHGQTSRAYQMLVDAYQIVLKRMHLKNLVLPAAMIAALCMGSARGAQASGHDHDHAVPGEVLLPTVATGAPGADGTYAYRHTVDPDGIFAGPQSPTTRTQGRQLAVIFYYHDASAPDMYNATDGAGSDGTWYNLLARNADSLRAYYAAQSGGKMDFEFKIVDVPLPAKPGGGLWDSGTAQAAYAESLGINMADYRFNLNFYQPGTDSWLIDNPNINPDGSYYASGLGTVGGPGTGNMWSGYNKAEGTGVVLHEIGHNFGLGHYSSLGTSVNIPAYVYDYATRTYKEAPAAAGPINAPMGLSRSGYGGAYGMMGNWAQGMTPRQKQSLGWLESRHFADIGKLIAPDTTGSIKLYDDMVDMPVVVNKASGPDVQYGVAHGYRDVYYNASFTRQGQAFHADSADTGHWENYTQRFDFFYRSGAESYPGYGNNNETPGIAVDLNGIYLGRLTLGQTLLEKEVANHMFVLEDGAARNMDDGSSVAGAKADLLTYDDITNRPQNPDRYRSVWYQITYLNNGTDANGHWADLQIQSFTGAQLAGWQFDANSITSGAQDGSGTWTAGGGSNWRNITLAVDNQNWTQDEDAVFGAGGAAGTVTIAETGVQANSIAFRKVASGNYTLQGGLLTLTYGGIVAEESATIESGVKITQDQFWSVSKDKTLTVSGSIDTTASLGLAARKDVNKDGLGTLVLGGVNTWHGDLSVNGGLVVQTADQTFVGQNAEGGNRQASLRLDEGTTYQVADGTLTFGNLSQIGGLKRPAFSTLHGSEDANLALGTLRLSSITGSTDAPELRLAANTTLRSQVQLDAGQHFINNDATSAITGDITGAGGITLYGNNSNRVLTLGGRILTDTVNTFSGDIEIRRGSLHVVGATSLQGDNVLRFNTAAGDTGRFYLRGFDRQVRDLSSNGDGSAIIANARGNNIRDGASPANLVVTQNNHDTYRGTLVDTFNDGGGSGAAGALGLVKKGNATLTLTGLNTYSGGTTIETGTLRIGGGGAIGTGAVTLAGGTLSVDQRQGLSLSKLGGGSMDTTTAVSGGAYTSDFSPLHAQDQVSGTFVYTGKIYLTQGLWAFGKSFDDGAFLKIDGQEILNNASWSSQAYGNITIAESGWYDIDLRLFNMGGGGPIAIGTWDNVKGIGVQKDAQTNSGADYTAFDPGALGLKLRDLNRMANAVVLADDSTVEILDQDFLEAESILAGGVTGAGSLTKTGSGTLTLAGTGNTYAGATIVSAGMFAAENANAFSAASAITLADTAGVTLDLRGFDQTIASLAGGGATGGTVALGVGTLTAGGDGTSTTYGGAMTGTGGLTKVGGGTMTLTGQNGYTGATTIMDGALRLDFAGASAASNLLSSASALFLGGGTLELRGKSGAVNTQAVNGVTLAAGTSSAVTLAPNGAATVNLRLGDIAVGAGAMLDFRGGTDSSTPGTGSGAWFSFTTVNGSTVAADARLGAFATWNGTDWAANSGVSDGAGGTYVQAYTGYTNIYNGTTPGTQVIQSGAADDVRINEATGGWSSNTLGVLSVTLNSLLMSAAGHAAGVDMAGGTLTVGGGAHATGAVAVGAGAKGLTLGTAVNQGTLTSGTSGQSLLGLISNNAAAADGLTVNAVIANGGTGTTRLWVSGGVGGGTVVLAGDNTYSGGTSVVSGATLQVGAGGGSGTLGSGAVALDLGTRLLFNRSDTVLQVSNAISGAGALIQGGAGTTTLTGDNTYAGATTILAGGTLRVGNGGTGGTLGTGAVLNDGTLSFNRSNGLEVANAIGGTGAVTQTGAGATTLTAANTYEGLTTIGAGTLQIGNGGTNGTLGSGAVAVASGARLSFKRSDNIAVANDLSGAGAWSQDGGATLVYTGTDSRTGATFVNAGTLQIGDGGESGTLGTGATTVASGAMLAFNRDGTLTVAGAISGAGTLLQAGPGTTVLTGDNAYGATLITAGTLQIGDGGRLGTGNVALGGGTLDFNQSGFLSVAQAITGTGAVSQSGPGTTLILGDNTYTGTTRIQGGTLQVGDGGTAGRLGNSNVDNDGALVFNRSDEVRNVAVISGTGTVRQSGSGTLVMVGNNTYSGGTFIDAGRTLQVGEGTGAGTLGTGGVTNDGTLVFNRNNNFTLSSVVSGGGTVIQNGTGTTILTGANTYAGPTTIHAGTLQIGAGGAAGSLGTGEVVVNAGGVLQTDRGTSSGATVDNTITLDGGMVRVNSWYSSLRLTGGLAIGAGGGTLAGHGSTVSTIDVDGQLTGSGALTLANGGNGGNFRINNALNTYSGTVTVGATTSQKLDVGAGTALRYATVNLAPASAATSLVTFAPTVTEATFGGLTGNGFGGMQLQNRAGTPQAVALTVNNAVDNAFNGVLSGAGSLIKANTGTLTLTRANTYTGGTTVSGGVLALDFSAEGAAASNILSASGAMTLNGGTLKIIGKAGQNGTVQSFAGLSAGVGTSTLQLVRNGATTMDINVGALSFGAGTLNFTGLTGTAAGARVITSTDAGSNNAQTQLSAASALWEGSDWASVQMSGGTRYVVKWLGTYAELTTDGDASGPTGDLRIQDGNGTGIAATYATDTTINSLMMAAESHATTMNLGAGVVLTVGASSGGNVAIAAEGRSLTIGQTVGQGTLTAGAAGTTATLNLANANAGSLLTVNADLADNAGGTTSVSAAGAGLVVLKGANTYTGSTSVGTGSLLQIAGSLGTAGTYAGDILNNGTLRLSAGGNQTLSGTLSGTGTLTKDAGASSDILTLSSAGNSISGDINISVGTLRLGADSALGSANVNIANGATLDLNGFSAGGPLVTIGGTGVGGTGALINAAAGQGSIKGLVLSGDLLVSNTSAQGAILIGSTTASNCVFDLAGHTLTKDGNGTLILNGVNATGAGDIIVNAGTLRFMTDYWVGGQQNTALDGAGTITIRSGASLATNRWASSFSLTKDIVLDGGSITGSNPGPNGATIASDISVTADSFINMGGGYGNATFSGDISGIGGLTFLGDGGTRTLSGVNTYSGATIVNAGVLKGGVANAFSADSSHTLANTATVVLDLGGFDQSIGSLAGGGATGGTVALGAGTLTLGSNNASASYAGVIGGGGGLTKVGSGVQTFTRAHTYTGLTTVSGGTLALDYAAGSDIIASGNDLRLAGGTVRFDNLGTGRIQTFGTTTLAADTSSSLLRGAGWVSGVAVNLGILGADGVGAALEVSDIVAAPSWIMASGNLNQATLLAGAVTTNNGANLVATDDAGHLILAEVGVEGDYVRNATLPNNADLNVRLIDSGGPGAGLTGTGFAGLATVGTTDFGTLLNAYTSGTSTVDITNSGVDSGNILRMGASGAIVAAAGSDLVIGASVAQGGTLTAGGADDAAGILSFNAGNHITVNAAIANNGSGQVALTKTGVGTLTLANTNAYSGPTTISQGTLQVGNGGTSGTLGSGAVSNNGILSFNRSNGLEVANAISGTGAVTQMGGGTTTLTGANSYEGLTTISAGTLQIGNGGASGTLGSGAVLNDGTLSFNRSNGLEVANAISGTGAVTQLGEGTTTLTGANSYEGLTTISQGTLQVGNGGTSGTLGTGAVLNDGTLLFNRSNGLEVANAISGTGAVTQLGAGTTTLTGENTYAGATTVSGGTLVLDFSAVGAPAANIVSASSSLILNGGTLLIKGTAGQDGVVQSFNGLTLTGASTLWLAQNGAISMDIHLGDISLVTGTLNFVDATGTEKGARLITTSSAGDDDGHTQLAGTSALWNGAHWASIREEDGVKYVVQWTGVSDDVYTGTDGGTVVIPSGANARDIRIVEGGLVGAPNTLAAATTTLNSLLMVADASDSVIKMDANSDNDTLVMGGGANANANMAIAAGAKSLTIGEIANQGFLTAGSSGDSTLNLANAGTGSILTINAIIQDNAGGGKVAMVVGASGAVFAGDNTYSGGTTITSGGTLQIGAGGGTGLLGSGGVANGGALIFNRNDTGLEVANAISGTGALTQLGTGTTTLTGANSYEGLTTISAGTLQIGNGGTSGTLGSGAVLNDGTLSFNRSNDLEVANAISGTGAVNQLGTGTTTLTGANSYEGLTTISQGTLQVGNGGASGTLGSGAVLNDGTLSFNRSNDLEVANAISGTGALTQLGTGTTTLTDANSYEGLTTISAGTLQIGNGGASGTLGSGAVSNNGTLSFNRSNDLEVANAISGTGAVIQMGTGTLTLTGENTYTGTTTVSGGTLVLDFSAVGAPAANIVSASSSLILNGGTLLIKGTAGQDGVVQSFNGLTNASGFSTFQLAQNDATSMDIHLGAIAVNSGMINFVGATGAAEGARLITTSSAGDDDGHTQLAGTMALWNGDTWASVRDVGGVKYLVEWTGVSDDVYTGTDGGTVVIPNGGSPQDVRILEGGLVGAPNTLAAAVTTLNSLLMVADASASVIRMDVHSANDTLVMGGGANANASILIGASARSLTIGETANQGFLTAGSSGDSTLHLANANEASLLAVNAVIRDNAGGGAVSAVVAGAVVFAGDNTHSGGTSLVSGATLRVGAGGSSGTLGSGGVDNEGTLVFDRDDTALEVAGIISGTGSLVQAGTGTTTLMSANTYTGATLVSGGTLAAGVDDAFGVDSEARVASGATLDMKAFSQSIGSLAGGGRVTNGSGAATLTTGGNDLSAEFTGDLAEGAGTLSLAKTGAGTQVFSGAVDYTGTTAVHGGALVFATSAALTGEVTVGADGILAIGRGSGAPNAHLLSFVSAVNDGTLLVNRDGRLDLGPANTLGGAGTLRVGGTLGVSGAVGTSNAAVFFNTGTLLLADGHSLFNAKDIAVVPGAKVAASSKDGFTPGELKTVARSSFGVDGSFAVDPALSAALDRGWRWITRTEGEDVLLGFLRAYLDSSGHTLQQQALAGGLNQAISGATLDPDVAAEYDRLMGLDDGELRGAFDRLAGHARAAMEPTVMRHAHDRGRNMLRLSRSERPSEAEPVAGAAAEALRATALDDVQSGGMWEEDLTGPRFFVRANRLRESRDAQAAGVAAASADGNRFTVGLHDEFGPGTNIGVAFTYDQIDMTTAGGLGKVDATTYGVDLFVSMALEEGSPFYVSGDAGFGVLDTDSKRHGITAGNLTATSSGGGMETHVSGEFGYKAQPWRGALLTPYAGLSYVDSRIKSERESLPGAPGLALDYQAHRTRSFESTLGADFAQSFDLCGGFTLTPSVGAAWHHRLGGDNPNVVVTHFAGASNTPFSTYLGALAKDALEVTAAAAVKMPGGMTASVNVRSYRALGSSNGSHQNSIGASLMWNF